LKNKNSKLNNCTNVDDQVFDSTNTITLLKHDAEPHEKSMSFYHSENRLVIKEQDDLFYKDFSTFLEKNQKK
jgi:hypothetical protein